MLRVDPSPVLFYFYSFIRSELVRVDLSWSDPDWRSELIQSNFCTCLFSQAKCLVHSCKKKKMEKEVVQEIINNGDQFRWKKNKILYHWQSVCLTTHLWDKIFCCFIYVDIFFSWCLKPFEKSPVITVLIHLGCIIY